MNDVVTKKTGFTRLSNGACIPVDATMNTDSTFNTELMAVIGDTMFLVMPKAYEMVEGDGCQYLGRMIVDESCIKEVVICKIIYATGCGVVLSGMTMEGVKESAIQELFYTSYEEAVNAIKSINSYYDENPNGDWIAECKNYSDFKYHYELQFPVKPQDVLLEDNYHYVANRIIVFISQDDVEVMYQGHDDESYENGKEVHSEHEYSGVKNSYQIVKLVEQKEVIIDV